MKIVIPMAGFGTRLRPHTWSKPKPLVTVAGKPVLGHVLDMFSTLPDIDEVIFIVGYLGDQIESYVSEAYPDLTARYVVQDEMLGQSHAIWLAREGLEGPMCMVFVDTIIEVDLSFLMTEKSGAVACVKEVEDPRRFGVAEVGADGLVRRLVEKPKDKSNNLVVVGFYYFQAAEELIASIEKQMEQGDHLGGEYYLADAINVMLEEGLEMRTESVEVWKDCGKADALLDTNRYLLGHGRDNSIEAERRDGALIIPPVFIDPSAEVSASVIGPNVSVSAGGVIKNSIVRDSIIEDDAFIENALLEESLVGRGARVSGTFKTANISDTSQVDI
jgi:glucose-1-phosphate thymidylyltransferase